jgi:hypothetical protein
MSLFKNVARLSSTTIGFLLGCFSFSGQAEVSAAESMANGKPYRAQLINSTFAQTPGNSFNQTILWLPLWQHVDKVGYLQFNLRNEFHGVQNLGANVGYRWLNPENSQLFGLHTGYSQQRSDLNHTFQQVSAGAEFRTIDWHAYGNIYLPISKAKRETSYDSWQVKPANDAFGFYNVMTTQGMEKALQGVDANIGYTFWNAFNARLYVGGYRYSASDVRTVAGPRVQFMFDFYNAFDRYQHSSFPSKITFNALFQDDRVHRNNWYAGITFSFTLGKQQALSGLRQYMQVEAPQNPEIMFRPNDTASASVYTNADGSPLTIGYADTASDLDNAVNNNAGVIAVRGSLDNLGTIKLNDNQVLTGGAYTLSNGVSLDLGNNGQLTAVTGQDLIQVAHNNHIENISLNADGGQHVIVNDLIKSSGYGKLTVNNVTANAGIKLQVADASIDNNLIFTNNTFALPALSNQNAVSVSLNSGTSHFNISDNHISFGAGGNNNGIELSSDFAGGNRSFLVDKIDNNSISFGDGTQNTGVAASLRDLDGIQATMTLSSLQNNTISFGDGDKNYGVNVTVSSVTGKGVLTLNAFNNNAVSYGTGNNNVAYSFTAGYTLADGAIILNGVANNQASFAAGNDNYGFQLLAGIDPDDQITVNVNQGQQGLAAANNNMSVRHDGKVDFSPAP